MTLYKIEDVIAEARPGMTRADILAMPYYEFAIKLDIMKERAEEQDKKGKKELKNRDNAVSKYKQGMPKVSSDGRLKPPKMPKLPKGF